jgi:hypothetical protein
MDEWSIGINTRLMAVIARAQRPITIIMGEATGFVSVFLDSSHASSY